MSSFGVEAQTFNSGSTGADGVLDLTAGDRQVQLPESGVLNYTTINIPAQRTLTFKSNLANTPVTMLAQGNVTIAGTVDVSALAVCAFCGSGTQLGRVPAREGFMAAEPDHLDSQDSVLGEEHLV